MKSAPLEWNARTTPAGGARVTVQGALVGALPTGLDTFLRGLAAHAHVVLDAQALDRVDTPALDALRAALGRFARVHVLLPGSWNPTSHLLRDALSSFARIVDCRPAAATSDRRQHLRQAARLEIVVSLADGREVTGTTENVSRGGALVLLGKRSRTNVHAARNAWQGTAGEALQVELPALGRARRRARVVGVEARLLRVAFDEPFELLAS